MNIKNYHKNKVKDTSTQVLQSLIIERKGSLDAVRNGYLVTLRSSSLSVIVSQNPPGPGGSETTFQNEGEMKTFTDKLRLGQFIKNMTLLLKCFNFKKKKKTPRRGSFRLRQPNLDSNSHPHQEIRNASKQIRKQHPGFLIVQIGDLNRFVFKHTSSFWLVTSLLFHHWLQNCIK